jgi:hypothetical protein
MNDIIRRERITLIFLENPVNYWHKPCKVNAM